MRKFAEKTITYIQVPLKSLEQIILFFFSQTTEWKSFFFLVSICAAIAEQISDPALSTPIWVKKNGTTLWANNSLNRVKYLNETDRLYICGERDFIIHQEIQAGSSSHVSQV